MKAKKQKNGIKVLLSLVVAITMIGIPATVFVAAAPPSLEDGPLITIEGTHYTGEAPPITYEGPIEDYTGPTYPATWIKGDSDINISCWGASDFTTGAAVGFTGDFGTSPMGGVLTKVHTVQRTIQ